MFLKSNIILSKKQSGTRQTYKGTTAQSSGQYLVCPAYGPYGIVLINSGTKKRIKPMSGGPQIKDEFL